LKQKEQQLQKESTENSVSSEIFTVADLRLLASNASEPVPSAWERIGLPAIDSLQPSDWSSLWLPDSTIWHPAVTKTEKPAASSIPCFSVHQVNWPLASVNNRPNGRETKEPATALPAFYRNETRGSLGRGGGGGRRSASQPSSPLSPYPRKRMKRS
jgi:hypothetical protein